MPPWHHSQPALGGLGNNMHHHCAGPYLVAVTSKPWLSHARPTPMPATPIHNESENYPAVLAAGIQIAAKLPLPALVPAKRERIANADRNHPAGDATGSPAALSPAPLPPFSGAPARPTPPAPSNPEPGRAPALQPAELVA